MERYLYEVMTDRREAKALKGILAGASALFRAGVALRHFSYEKGFLSSERLPAFVISVGNIAVGGTGKTPFVALLAEELHKRGKKVPF